MCWAIQWEQATVQYFFTFKEWIMAEAITNSNAQVVVQLIKTIILNDSIFPIIYKQIKYMLAISIWLISADFHAYFCVSFKLCDTLSWPKFCSMNTILWSNVKTSCFFSGNLMRRSKPRPAFVNSKANWDPVAL